jgi:hypothetical protein
MILTSLILKFEHYIWPTNVLGQYAQTTLALSHNAYHFLLLVPGLGLKAGE